MIEATGFATRRLALVLAVATAVVATWLAGAFAVAVGPDVEARLFPVIERQAAFDVARAGDEVTFRVWMEKPRGCLSVEGATFWTAEIDLGNALFVQRILVENESREPADGKPSVGRTGRGQAVIRGPFRAVLSGPAHDADRIVARMFFRCHVLWLTPAVFVAFDVPGAG